MSNYIINNKLIKGLNRLFISPFLLSFSFANHPINIDGLFDDWQNVPLAYSDTYGDAVEADYSTLKITYDSEFLFIYFKFHDGEFLIQNWNDFHLYVDADSDSSTGYYVHGIGAELDWNFGERSGYQYLNEDQIEIYQNDITLRMAPTVTSMEFEIAISRYSSALTIGDSHSLSHCKIVLSELETGGDILPDTSGGINFTIIEDNVLPPEPITLERSIGSDIRIVSYNTLNEGILDSDRQIHFKRILQSIDPDVIALQEHGDWDQIDDIIQSWFPSEQWNASWTYRDLVILSRFSIINDASMISSERTMVALLNTEDELGQNLLVFNSHLSCCDNNEERQQQVDEFISSWRNWILNDSGPFHIEQGTPFIHVGDFNFVGYKQQVETIRIGDIENEEQYGNDFLPDWDSTAIVDLFLRHTHKRMGYTWRKDWSSFSPGKLDYIFYSNATINVAKNYILNTLAMDDLALDYYELEWDDTQEASDHLPLVFDISINDFIGIEEGAILPHSSTLISNYPNPFNSRTMISIYLSNKGIVEVWVYDIVGNRVKMLLHDNMSKGNISIDWDGTDYNGRDVASGIYLYMLKVNGVSYAGKMILLK